MGKLLDDYKAGFDYGVRKQQETNPGDYSGKKPNDNAFRQGTKDGKQAIEKAIEKIKPQFEDK